MMNPNKSSNVFIPQPITVEKKNTRGRPRKIVNADLLKEAMEPTRRISQVLLAEKLGIHRNTLRGKLKENSINTSFSDISDGDLDQIVKGYRDSHPNSGIRFVGALEAKAFESNAGAWKDPSNESIDLAKP